MLVGQIGPSAGGGNPLLIQRDQPLDIDHRVGLHRPDGVNCIQIALVKPLVIIIAQLIDPKGQIYLPILLQSQRLQQGVFLPVNGQRLFLRQLENGQAVGGQIISAANAAVNQKSVGPGVADKGGVLKIAVVHRRRLRSGLGKVIALCRRLWHGRFRIGGGGCPPLIAGLFHTAEIGMSMPAFPGTLIGHTIRLAGTSLRRALRRRRLG